MYHNGAIPTNCLNFSNIKKVIIVCGPILIQLGINPLYSPNGPSERKVLKKQSKADLYFLLSEKYRKNMWQSIKTRAVSWEINTLCSKYHRVALFRIWSCYLDLCNQLIKIIIMVYVKIQYQKQSKHFENRKVQLNMWT